MALKFANSSNIGRLITTRRECFDALVKGTKKRKQKLKKVLLSSIGEKRASE